MRGHGDRLRALLAEETGGAVTAPADDAAIRAHLRFALAALEATLSEPLRARVAGLADDLPGWFEDGSELYEEQLARGAGAIALEQHLQFGVRPGSDPSLDEGLMRRVRIGAWMRLALLGLEERLGPAADGVAEETLAWMGAHQRQLGRLILSLDRRARTAAGPAAASDLAIQDEIGQAAVVQAHVRLLIEALAVGLATT
jgi:hypothetical protein